MNTLDIVIAVFLILLVILGVKKGFIISLASLAALILGVYIAVHFSNYLDGILMEHLKPSQTWLPILSFTITFLLVVILVLLLAKALEKVVDIAGMGLLNHIAGGIFGLAKGILLLSVLFFIIAGFDPHEKLIPKKTKDESLLYRKTEWVFPAMMKLFGGKIKFPEILQKEKKK